MSNVIFIGMPYSGKSFVGSHFAKKYNKQFIDPDKIIETEYGTKLGNIIKKYSLSEFMNIEKKVLKNLYNVRNSVISPGGSIIYYDDIIKELKKNSIFVYLDVDLKILKSRITNIEDRGIVMKPGTTYDTLYYDRTLLYNKYCDIKINYNNDTNLTNLVHNIYVEYENKIENRNIY